jgi:uncharacterized protein (TIGR02246 family)
MIAKRMLSRGLAAVVVSGITATANPAPHPFAATGHRPYPDAANGDQLAAASRLANTFASTWNRRDGVGYGAAYWPDAELVDPSGQVWNGRRAIIQTHLDLWAGPAKHTEMSARVRRVRALSPSLFVVDIDTSATGFSQPPPGAPDRANPAQTRCRETQGAVENTHVSEHICQRALTSAFHPKLAGTASDPFQTLVGR